jgi:hypothetical protein
VQSCGKVLTLGNSDDVVSGYARSGLSTGGASQR